MYKILSAVFNKMESWFGVVFKILIPALVMILPIKLTTYSIYIYGVTFGGDYYSLSGFSEVLFYILYALLILAAILFPRVASAMEFVIIPYYVLTLVISSMVSDITMMLTSFEEQLTSYWYALPFVMVFLVFKIIFYFFIRSHKELFLKEKEEKYEKNNDYYV